MSRDDVEIVYNGVGMYDIYINQETNCDLSVYDVNGEVKERPLHAVTDHLTRFLKIAKFNPRYLLLFSHATLHNNFFSGAAGYLDFFQPPFLSRCPATREQQRVILIACTGFRDESLTSLQSSPTHKLQARNCKHSDFLSALHFYPMIMRACGECPAIHLVSKEPETHKT